LAEVQLVNALPAIVIPSQFYRRGICSCPTNSRFLTP